MPIRKLAGQLLPLHFFDREAHFYFPLCAKTNTSSKKLNEAKRNNTLCTAGSESKKSLSRRHFL